MYVRMEDAECVIVMKVFRETDHVIDVLNIHDHLKAQEHVYNLIVKLMKLLV